MKLIDGKLIAAEIKHEIAVEVAKIIDAGGEAPHLAAILVGDDAASQAYVRNKEKACQEVGFTSSVYRFPSSISEQKLLEAVDFVNSDDQITGFIVQLPLPLHISPEKVIERIDPLKDVDGFHPQNVGKMVLNLPGYLPATPYGIIQLLERSGIETEGKNCVILGRSNIVGTPLSILLSRKANPGNCTVTMCHSKSKNIKAISSQADILIAAIGQQGYVTADMVKHGAVVIDVGMHRIPSSSSPTGFRFAGDVDFDNVAPKCSYITPVPGGVGPMTIVALIQNTFKAYRSEFKL
ncbi:MAG: bifunctional 5,10-methylenetetrahydrofolate dehydrogenase/5,10-methenyltetrahydrofolate cyclohydrolase [Bacteroidales bacterium]